MNPMKGDGVKRCVCLIHASGTLGKFNRKCTDRYKWEEAKQVAAAWELAGSWERIKPAAAASELEAATLEPPAGPDAITVERAVAEFLAEQEENR